MSAVETSAAEETSRQRALARMSPAERDGVTCGAGSVDGAAASDLRAGVQ